MKIAIASGKGGTGKTTLATNLASYLAEENQVVLTDLDVEEPNSGLFIRGELREKRDMFKMIPVWTKDKCTLCGRCNQVCNFNAVIKLADRIMIFSELCHSCYACSELCPMDALAMRPQKMGEMKVWQTAGFDFIESRLDIGQEQAVPLIAQTIDHANDNFKDNSIFIYDSPPGTSCPVIEATKDADLIILITEPTPFGFHDLKLAVETMEELKKRYVVVINRYGIGNDDVLDYCRENDIEVIAKLPNDRRIAEMYSRGELVYKHFDDFKEQLSMIAEYIFCQDQGGEL